MRVFTMMVLVVLSVLVSTAMSAATPFEKVAFVDPSKPVPPPVAFVDPSKPVPPPVEVAFVDPSKPVPPPVAIA